MRDATKLRKKNRLSQKIRKYYRDTSTEISPLMSTLLVECDRIQEIQDRLWEQATAEPVIVEYTNKAGASNMVANAALRELRSWELVFQGHLRSVRRVLHDDFITTDEIDEELKELF